MGSNIPLPALSVRPPEQQDLLQKFQQLSQLKAGQQQQQLAAEQLKGAQLQNQQAQRDIQDQQTVAQVLAQNNGDLNASLPMLSGKILPKNYLPLVQANRQLIKDAQEATDKDLDIKIKRGSELQNVIDYGKNLPPDQYAAQFPQLVAKAKQIDPKLQIDDSQVIPQDQLDKIGLGIVTHTQAYAAEAERRAAKKAPFEQQRAEAEAATAQAQASVAPQNAQLSLQEKRSQIAQNQAQTVQAYASAQKSKAEAANLGLTSNARDMLAQDLANGQLTRLKDVASMRGGDRLLIYARAKQLNPNFNPSEVDRKVKMEDDIVNGEQGKQIQSFGTFLEHAGTASDLVDNFRNTNVKLVNTAINKIRSNFGDTQYTQITAALEPVKKEVESFLLGGHALYADDRKAADTILNVNSSPAQIQEALKQLGHTAGARFNEINYRYKRLIGHDIEEPFSPEAQQAAGKLGVSLGGGQQQQGAPAGNDPFAAFGGKAR